MASTLLHEQGWNHQAIERQLAHTERNGVSAAYNYAEHLPERRKMMQAWADYLDMLREERNEFPFTKLTDEANVFVFPNLDAANIGYKLLWRLAGAEVIGPVLLGMNKPVNVLQMHSDVQNIVSLAAVTALRAQSEEFPF